MNYDRLKLMKFGCLVHPTVDLMGGVLRESLTSEKKKEGLHMFDQRLIKCMETEEIRIETKDIFMKIS